MTDESEQTANEHDALDNVIEALTPLDASARERVLKAAGIFLGVHG